MQAPPPTQWGPPTDAPVTSEVAPDVPLLRAAAHGDGDSWRDTAGRDHRLGMVNAPGQDECFGAEATAERQRQVAAGFRAQVYSVDRYGRSVSLVTTVDGVALNVHMARQGFVDDRYLADFRHEHPALAAELDEAFAEARAHARGLWSACGGDAAPASPVTDVAPAGPAATQTTPSASRRGRRLRQRRSERPRLRGRRRSGAGTAARRRPVPAGRRRRWARLRRLTAEALPQAPSMTWPPCRTS